MRLTFLLSRKFINASLDKQKARAQSLSKQAYVEYGYYIVTKFMINILFETFCTLIADKLLDSTQLKMTRLDVSIAHHS